MLAFGRFNGAGTARSRKWSPAFRSSARASSSRGRDRAVPEMKFWDKNRKAGTKCFNGAGTARSRKWRAAALAVSGRRRRSSMGPGPRGPGNRGIRAAPGPGRSWLHGAGTARSRKSLAAGDDGAEVLRDCFNGAGTARSRKYGWPARRLHDSGTGLQWGSGPRGPGNAGAFRGSEKLPGCVGLPWGRRTGGPGNLYEVIETVLAISASMGPGPRGPGTERSARIHVIGPCSLQWAGTARSRKCRFAPIRPIAPRSGSFNGAGTARSRKCLGSSPPACSIHSFNGPGPRGPGNV